MLMGNIAQQLRKKTYGRTRARAHTYSIKRTLERGTHLAPPHHLPKHTHIKRPDLTSHDKFFSLHTPRSCVCRHHPWGRLGQLD